jgi:lysine-N-methylase
MALSVLGPKYAQRFSCIGSACESTCCAGWTITVDRAHYMTMRSAFEQRSEDREAFHTKVKVLKQDRSKEKYALLVLNPKNGDCSFHGEDGLCDVQRRFGEHALPDVCATYPRRQSLVGERVELTASLSCPEIARLALLPHDAMELVELDTKRIVRNMVQQATNDGQPTYERSVDAVRMTMMNVLARVATLPAKLAALAALAELLGEAFGKGKPFEQAALDRALEQYNASDWAAQMELALGSIDMPLEVPLRPLVELLAMRANATPGPFASNMVHATAAYGLTTSDITESSKAFLTRREQCSDAVEGRLTDMLTNYALNHTFSYWFTSAPNLGIWVRGLILRIALTRFLVYAHPQIGELKNAPPSEEASRTVERVTVEVIHRLARAIEHNPPFLAALDEALPRKLPGLEHALCLLKI